MTLHSVQQHRDRLQAVFDLASGMVPGEPLQAHVVQYLCVRVQGLLEQSIQLIYFEHARTRSQPSVASYVGKALKRLPRNLSWDELCQLAGRFDPGWETQLRDFMKQEHKDAIRSVLTNRNKIAHGESVSLGLHQLKDWNARITDVVDYIES